MKTLTCALIGGIALSLPLISAAQPDPMSIRSTSFEDGKQVAHAMVGTDEACGTGKGLSPQLSWKSVPPKTKSLAVIGFDPDGAKGLGVIHWVAYNIDPSIEELRQGEGSGSSDRITVGKNSKGDLTYRGLCPPAGDGIHHYAFTVIATDLPVGKLGPGLTRDELLKELSGHSLVSQTIVGLYGH
ncbi:YbhB/YbcL family Raf kinase inhibitor-like protein [Pseudomonas nicosulfuronedens]